MISGQVEVEVFIDSGFVGSGSRLNVAERIAG